MVPISMLFKSKKTILQLGLYYIACTLILIAVEVIEGFALNSNILSTFALQASLGFDAQFVFMTGTFIGGTAVAIFPRFFSCAEKVALIVAGTASSLSLLCGYVGQTGRYLFPPALLMVLLGLGYGFSKILVLLNMIKRGHFSLFAMCVAVSSSCVESLLGYTGVAGFAVQCGLLYVAMVVAPLLMFVLALCDSRLPSWDKNDNRLRNDRWAGYLVGRAALALVVYATLRVFTLSKLYANYPVTTPLGYMLSSLTIPMLVWFVFVWRLGKPYSQPSFSLALFFSLFGLLAIVLDTSDAWVMTDRQTTLVTITLMNFSATVFWCVIYSTCWAAHEYSMRILGVAMGAFAAVSALWVQLLACFGAASLSIVVGVACIGAWAVTRLYPRIVDMQPGREARQNSKNFNMDSKGRNPSQLAEQYSLSVRETEVFLLLAQGRTRKYIQQHLCISDGTAKTYISRIYKKLGVRGREGMVALLNGDEVDKCLEESQ